MRILVTGARGFIGRSLVEWLSPRHAVIGYGHEQLNLFNSEQVHKCISMGNFDVVIHAAGYDSNSPVVFRDENRTLEYNLRMFVNLARESQYYDRLIYFGSGAEVPLERRHTKMDELDCQGCPPYDPYGLSKYLMNRYAITTNQIVNIRLFGVFGKYDDWRYRVIPNLCAQAVHCDKLILKRNALHDFMYIDDLCKAVELISDLRESVTHPSYNVCPGHPITFRRLALIVRDVSGRDLPVECPDEYFHSYSGDNTRFTKSFPRFIFTPMEIAIRKMYSWFYVNRNSIPKDEILKWL